MNPRRNVHPSAVLLFNHGFASQRDEIWLRPDRNLFDQPSVRTCCSHAITKNRGNVDRFAKVTVDVPAQPLNTLTRSLHKLPPQQPSFPPDRKSRVCPIWDRAQ